MDLTHDYRCSLGSWVLDGYVSWGSPEASRGEDES